LTDHERRLARALGGCGGWTGARFCRDIAALARMSPEADLSLRQRHYMELLAWRYRAQLPRELVPERKPLDLPAQSLPPAKKRERSCAAVMDAQQLRLI
jgi:hypothetical protein